jgi:hypothetical protein
MSLQQASATRAGSDSSCSLTCAAKLCSYMMMLVILAATEQHVAPGGSGVWLGSSAETLCWYRGSREFIFCLHAVVMFGGRGPCRGGATRCSAPASCLVCLFVCACHEWVTSAAVPTLPQHICCSRRPAYVMTSCLMLAGTCSLCCFTKAAAWLPSLSKHKEVVFWVMNWHAW